MDIETRRAKCEQCGADGYHVDTDAGEIVVGGDVVASVEGETLLMADARGHLICDDCDEQARLQSQDAAEEERRQRESGR